MDIKFLLLRLFFFFSGNHRENIFCLHLKVWEHGFEDTVKLLLVEYFLLKIRAPTPQKLRCRATSGQEFHKVPINFFLHIEIRLHKLVVRLQVLMWYKGFVNQIFHTVHLNFM